MTDISGVAMEQEQDNLTSGTDRFGRKVPSIQQGAIRRWKRDIFKWSAEIARFTCELP
jgi:hypothetical protein